MFLIDRAGSDRFGNVVISEFASYNPLADGQCPNAFSGWFDVHDGLQRFEEGRQRSRGYGSCSRRINSQGSWLVCKIEKNVNVFTNSPAQG
jgi:hypothetical protein